MANTIHTPSLVKVDEHSAVSASFTVEPLHSGYGMTLGNSIRRVLLSSIAGAAVTSFKIEGITHEFTDVPGIKEDAVDIMLLAFHSRSAATAGRWHARCIVATALNSAQIPRRLSPKRVWLRRTRPYCRHRSPHSWLREADVRRSLRRRSSRRRCGRPQALH